MIIDKLLNFKDYGERKWGKWENGGIFPL